MCAKKTDEKFRFTVLKDGFTLTRLPNGAILSLLNKERQQVMWTLGLIESMLTQVHPKDLSTSIFGFDWNSDEEHVTSEVTITIFNDGDVSLAIAGGEELYLSSVQVEGAFRVVRLFQYIFNPKTVDVPAEGALSLEAELDSIPDADLFPER